MLDPFNRFFLMTEAKIKDAVAKSRDEQGASAVEYGLLVGLIAVVIVLSVTTLGTTLKGLFDSINGSI
jgi:pilus assembly protein Flp/PilA